MLVWLHPDTTSIFRSARKGEREARALPDGAVTMNRAVVLADDAVRDRQPESRAAANGLRREERVVDARQMRRWNSGARVGDLHEGMVALEARLHGQPAAARHRVACVEKQ